MRSPISRAVFTWAILTAPAAVLADSKPHTHDGFFLRLQAGVGGTSATNDAVPEITLSGPAGQLSADIGGAVTPNLIIFGKLFGNRTSDPTLKVDDLEVELDGFDGVYGGVGAGVSYYFMPVNLFITGALSVASLGLESERFTSDATGGLTLHLGVGKEWWVSDNWALGVAAELLGGSYPDNDRDDAWRAGSFIVSFSATYN